MLRCACWHPWNSLFPGISSENSDNNTWCFCNGIPSAPSPLPSLIWTGSTVVNNQNTIICVNPVVSTIWVKKIFMINDFLTLVNKCYSLRRRTSETSTNKCRFHFKIYYILTNTVTESQTICMRSNFSMAILSST